MYIGLDLGTSGLKGVLIDDAQAVLAEASAPLTVSRRHDGWSEQSPADWIAAAETVLDALSAHGLSKVQAIGLSGQMHGATLLDSSNQIIRPAILWNDGRAFAQCQQLQQQVPQLQQLTAAGEENRNAVSLLEERIVALEGGAAAGAPAGTAPMPDNASACCRPRPPPAPVTIAT